MMKLPPTLQPSANSSGDFPGYCRAIHCPRTHALSSGLGPHRVLCHQHTQGREEAGGCTAQPSQARRTKADRQTVSTMNSTRFQKRDPTSRLQGRWKVASKRVGKWQPKVLKIHSLLSSGPRKGGSIRLCPSWGGHWLINYLPAKTTPGFCNVPPVPQKNK